MDAWHEYRNLAKREQDFIWKLTNDGLHKQDPGEDTVARAFRHLLPTLAVDQCISTFSMHDPAASTKHCGLAGEVPDRAFRRHRAEFRCVFSRVKVALRKAMATRQQNVVIALYWKSGRHRSVAAASCSPAWP